MKTEFPRTHLAAVSNFMATKDIRYYLNGVCVEMLAGETRLVATDGNVLGAARHVVDNAQHGQVIVPAATVALAVKMPGEFLALERDAAGQWRLAGIPFTPADGLFPAYRRVISSTWSDAAGNYDPELLMRFVKAARALKHKGYPIVRQNGTDAAMVHFYNVDNFVGVISPVRMFNEKQPDLGAPSWGSK